MYSLFLSSLAVLSLAARANGYEYGGDGLTTGGIVVRCIHLLVCLGLAGLCVLPLVMARGNRFPYVFLFIALAFIVIALPASIAYIFIGLNVDVSDNGLVNVLVALNGIKSLFSGWSLTFMFLAFAHLIKVRSDNISRSLGDQSAGLGSFWTIAYFVMFAILLVFSTAEPAVYIDLISNYRLFGQQKIIQRIRAVEGLSYTWGAIWVCTPVLIGFLAYSAYKAAKRAGVIDKILKALLFVALPLHILNVIQNIIFTILFSPSGLKITDTAATRHAELASVILSLGLQTATMAVLVFLGIRRSHWVTGSAANEGQQKEQYSGDSSYPSRPPSYEANKLSKQVTGSKREEMYLHL